MESIKGYLTVFDNEIVVAVLAIILVLYSSLAAPKLPAGIAGFLENPWVRLLFIALIAFLATKNAMLSILVALAFVLTIMAFNSPTIDVSGRVENLLQGDLYSAVSPAPRNVKFNLDEHVGYDETGFAEESLQ